MQRAKYTPEALQRAFIRYWTPRFLVDAQGRCEEVPPTVFLSYEDAERMLATK